MSSEQSSEAIRYMSRAMQLARRGLYSTSPNPRVGCVIVHKGEVVGEGWHEQAGQPHAEINALRQAGALARGSTAYVTLEPCAHHGRTGPCCVALAEAGIAQVVIAGRDPNALVAGQGIDYLQTQGIEVTVGIEQQAAQALNAGFFMRHTRGRPWVRCKLAMSVDGRTALASGESQWITGTPARRDVQRLRARSCAIVTGSGTVLADDPALTVRREELEVAEHATVTERQPLRVVLDSQLRTPISARLLTMPGKTLLMAAEDAAQQHRVEELAALPRVEVITVPRAGAGLDLDAVLKELVDRECNEVLFETGPTLAGSLVNAGLFDELIIYVAARIMGDQARSLLALPPVMTMQDTPRLQFEDVRSLGDDLRLTLIQPR